MRGKAPNRGGIVSATEGIRGGTLDPDFHPEHAAGQGIGGKVRALGAGGDEKLIHIPPAEAGAGDVGAGQLHPVQQGAGVRVEAQYGPAAPMVITNGSTKRSTSSDFFAFRNPFSYT